MQTFQIKESYKITKQEDMINTLKYYQENKLDNDVISNRSIDSLVREWQSHNLLYNLHLFRSHTADVDFEYPLKMIYKISWYILSSIYRIFY